MKIDITQIPFEGFSKDEEIDPQELDFDTEVLKFRSSIKVRAFITRITNAVSVRLKVSLIIGYSCSRCLEPSQSSLNKEINLNFSVENDEKFIDLNPEIREEIIVDYPIKPLCKIDCLGLCFKCGKDLNKGKCNC